MRHTWTEDPMADDESTLENERLQIVEQKHMDTLRSGIEIHALPAVLVGFGASTAAHKVATLAHALRLEHFTHESLVTWVDGLVSVMSDMGTESLLTRVRPVKVSDVCPFFLDTPEHEQESIMRALPSRLSQVESGRDHGDQEHTGEADVFEEPIGDDTADLFGTDMEGLIDREVFESCSGDEGADTHRTPDDSERPLCNEVFEAPPQMSMLQFSHALDVPGLHHLIDNATSDLPDLMPHYDKFVYEAQVICKLLRRRDLRDKLLERCFSSPLGQQFVPLIMSFKGHIHTGRWGTVAFSVPELLQIERALRWGWSKAKFLGDQGAASVDGPGGAEATSNMAMTVDAAVGSQMFWSWLRMLEALSATLRKASAWADGCACHSDLHDVFADVPLRLQRQWASCPMRGMRAPELSAGLFTKLFTSLCKRSAAELMVDLHRDLQAEERADIISEYGLAASHMCFYVVLKLAHFRELPWKVFQVAHYDISVAHAALAECLSATHKHPISR